MDNDQIRAIEHELKAMFRERKFAESEELLRSALAKVDTADIETRLILWKQLKYLSPFLEAQEAGQTEAIYLEIETLEDTAYNRLQTAMFYYVLRHDAPRAAPKAREAIRKARETDESAVIYQALALLGRTLLDMGETHEPERILAEIEQRILALKKCVSGDETWFLESAAKHGVGLETVRRIAKLIGPHCREEQFVRRLKALED